jgi:hypothetical protein
MAAEIARTLIMVSVPSANEVSLCEVNSRERALWRASRITGVIPDHASFAP